MIAVVFDELDVVASRLGEARSALTARDATIPTDAGTPASDVVAGAAGAFVRTMTRRRRAGTDAWEALRTGVAGAADDFREFEHSALDALQTLEAAL